MDILTFGHYDVKKTSYMKIFDEVQGLELALSAKLELDKAIILKIIQVSLFFLSQKMM